MAAYETRLPIGRSACVLKDLISKQTDNIHNHDRRTDSKIFVIPIFCPSFLKINSEHLLKLFNIIPGMIWTKEPTIFDWWEVEITFR